MRINTTLFFTLFCSCAFAQDSKPQEQAIFGAHELEWNLQYNNVFQNQSNKANVAAQLHYRASGLNYDYITLAVGFDLTIPGDPLSPYKQQLGREERFLCDIDLDLPNNVIGLYSDDTAWPPGKTLQCKMQYVAKATAAGSPGSLTVGGFGVSVSISGPGVESLSLGSYTVFSMNKPCGLGTHLENGVCVPDTTTGGGSGGASTGGTGSGGTGGGTGGSSPCENCEFYETCYNNACRSPCEITPCPYGYDCNQGVCTIVTSGPVSCIENGGNWPQCCLWAWPFTPACLGVPPAFSASYDRIAFDGGTLFMDPDNNGLSGLMELFTGISDNDGDVIANPIEALFLFDQKRFGGDEDGVITPGDTIWRQLYVLYDKDTYDNGPVSFSLTEIGVDGIFAEDLELF